MNKNQESSILQGVESKDVFGETVGVPLSKSHSRSTSESEVPICRWPYLKYGIYNLRIRIDEFLNGAGGKRRLDNRLDIKQARREEKSLAEIAKGHALNADAPEQLVFSKNLLEQERIFENTKARRRLERWATRLIMWYLIAVFILIVVNGFINTLISALGVIMNKGIVTASPFISDTIMGVILTTTTINIIGLGIIVLKGHFSENISQKENPKSKEEEVTSV